MSTQSNEQVNQLNPESAMAEAAAQSAWKKMQVVTRIISIGGLLIVFDIGKAFWPNWLIAHQLQAFLFVMLALIIVMLITPRIVAAVAKNHVHSE